MAASDRRTPPCRPGTRTTATPWRLPGEGDAGRRLSPRIAKLAEKPLWRPHVAERYQRWPKAGTLLRLHARADLVTEHWDDLLRVGGSLKLGHVSAALLVARLQAGSRQHPLAKALVEYGKVLRTVHALRWFTDEAFRRRIGRQLNRGEAIAHLSPAHFEAINPYGTLSFDVAGVLKRSRRPLRSL